MGNLPPDSEKRFWSKVDKSKLNECWEWKGYCNPAGYGKININGLKYYTHRVSWSIYNRSSIPEKMYGLRRKTTMNAIVGKNKG